MVNTSSRKRFAIGGGGIAIIVATIGTFQGVPAKVIDRFTDIQGDKPTAPPAPTGARFPVISPSLGETSARITFPLPGGVANMESKFSGHTTNTLQNHQVWAVVESEGRYYPQDGPYTLLPDGRWSGTVFIGDESESGELFVLHVVKAGPTGAAQFNEYLRKESATDSLEGMLREEIASDVQFLDKVGVIRE